MEINCPKCSYSVESLPNSSAPTTLCPKCGTLISLRVHRASRNIPSGQFPRVETRSLPSLLFHFSGRIRRREYWAITLGSGAVYGALVVGLAMLVEEKDESIPKGIYVGLLVGTLAYCWVNIACNFQRWHDRDKSGFWSLVSLIPLVGWIWALIETGFLPGTPGRNRFGPPLG